MDKHIGKAENVTANHPFPVVVNLPLFNFYQRHDRHKQPNHIYQIERDAIHFSPSRIRGHVSRSNVNNNDGNFDFDISVYLARAFCKYTYFAHSGKAKTHPKVRAVGGFLSHSLTQKGHPIQANCIGRVLPHSVFLMALYRI